MECVGLEALRCWIIGDFAFFLQLLDVLVDTKFGDRPDGTGAHFERYPFVRFRNEKLFGLQVWEKTTLGLCVGVGDVVPRDRLLSRQVTNSRH